MGWFSSFYRFNEHTDSPLWTPEICCCGSWENLILNHCYLLMLTIHYSHRLKHLHHIDIIPVFCAVYVHTATTVLRLKFCTVVPLDTKC